MDDETLSASKAYLDGIFGAGAGEAHAALLDRFQNASIREQLHRAHVMQADDSTLSVSEHYLIGMCVLCATKTWVPAEMFAKTLRHLGVSGDKILEAVARLGVFIGPVPAADAMGHIQKAVKEYDREGIASLRAWFPPQEQP